MSHTAICAVAHNYGMDCDITKDFERLDSWLMDEENPAPVIAHVRHKRLDPFYRCKFTRAGHYIVVVGHVNPDGSTGENGKYIISDSNSCEEDRMHATEDELDGDCELVGFIRMSPRK